MPDFKKVAEHPMVAKSLSTYARQQYTTPFFVLREMLAGFKQHNAMSLSASLSFYALFALIPLVLLMFFLLSHLVFSSDYAIVKLAILTGNLVPNFGDKIMVEVYNATQTKAAWGVFGLIVLFWTITPLAGAMRSSFHTILAKKEMPSFLGQKLQDIFSVLGILLLFFLFTAAGLLIEKVVRFLASHFSAFHLNLIGALLTLILTTILMTGFYRLFLPLRIALGHLLLGAFVTTLLWLLMRPAFGLFLSLNQNYGAVFGSMKALFVSITWLYLNFAVFLLGTELIATLRKKDVLLLKGLFDHVPNKASYIEALMSRYGLDLKAGDKVFEVGNQENHLYYIVEGAVDIIKQDIVTRTLNSNDFFGEIAMLSKQPTNADAVVNSNQAKIIVIYAENIEALLEDDPQVAMQLLKTMANKLQNN